MCVGIQVVLEWLWVCECVHPCVSVVTMVMHGWLYIMSVQEYVCASICVSMWVTECVCMNVSVFLGELCIQVTISEYVSQSVRMCVCVCVHVCVCRMWIYHMIPGTYILWRSDAIMVNFMFYTFYCNKENKWQTSLPTETITVATPPTSDCSRHGKGCRPQCFLLLPQLIHGGFLGCVNPSVLGWAVQRDVIRACFKLLHSWS